jgi:predicted dehydrogenase
VARAERRGTRLQVGHIERFAPAFCALRERVVAPRLIECVRRTPWSGRAVDVDVVLDLMIHDIDLVLTLAGAPVISVAASGVLVATNHNDVAEARVVFENGVVATLAASRVAPAGERSISVTEAGRRLVANLAAQELTVFPT